MSQQTINRWESMRTPETRKVEEVVRVKFPKTDAYRFNSASIRVRIIDDRFEGHSREERDAMVEPLLDKLPATTQADIINLLTLTPGEINNPGRRSLSNLEFEDPSDSNL